VAVTLALVGALLGRTGLGREVFGNDTGDATSVDPDQVAPAGDGPLPVAATASFDPFGTGGEHDELLGRLVDADQASLWRTEGYNDELTATKPGVGVILDLAGSASLGKLVVATATTGWAASVYVADDRQGDLAAWGEPVAQGSDLTGSQEFPLDGAEGRSVLLWLTDLGGANRVEIGDASLYP